MKFELRWFDFYFFFSTDDHTICNALGPSESYNVQRKIILLTFLGILFGNHFFIWSIHPVVVAVYHSNKTNEKFTIFFCFKIVMSMYGTYTSIDIYTKHFCMNHKQTPPAFSQIDNFLLNFFRYKVETMPKWFTLITKYQFYYKLLGNLSFCFYFLFF